MEPGQRVVHCACPDCLPVFFLEPEEPMYYLVHCPISLKDAQYLLQSPGSRKVVFKASANSTRLPLYQFRQYWLVPLSYQSIHKRKTTKLYILFTFIFRFQCAHRKLEHLKQEFNSNFCKQSYIPSLSQIGQSFSSIYKNMIDKMLHKKTIASEEFSFIFKDNWKRKHCLL